MAVPRALAAAALVVFCAALITAAAGDAGDEHALQVAQISQRDALGLWRRHTVAAGEAVAAALAAEPALAGAAVRGADLESLRIWHGQRLELALRAGAGAAAREYRFFSTPDPGDGWAALADALPAAAAPDGALERDWLAPVARGPALAPFVVEGPLELALPEAADLALWLPHPVDVPRVRRVLLREGAAVAVSGASSCSLRRPADLPAVSLSDFAAIATDDERAHGAPGLAHLAAGLREAAARRWNASAAGAGAGTSPALVSLELRLRPSGASLVAAPGAGGAPPRLRVRRLGGAGAGGGPSDALDAIELSLADPAAGGGSGSERAAGALVPAPAAAAGHHHVWPLRSVAPQHLQAYERLLREVLASQLFGTAAGGAGGGAGGVRPAADVPLRLLASAAEAVTLLEMEVQVERPAPAAPPTETGRGLPGAGALLAAASAGGGRPTGRETWRATLQVRGGGAAPLRFEPLRLQRTGGVRDSVTLSQGYLQAMLLRNATLPEGAEIAVF